ncbi:hypothetical protein VNO78_26538 [Psophocarpus tetragonolobus]|uniref:Uncharacterized protein n=1 Tax=Psophocarpus tetragonolobus TaxID=3891 RepID=A0AAN9X910_PSOTE
MCIQQNKTQCANKREQTCILLVKRFREQKGKTKRKESETSRVAVPMGCGGGKWRRGRRRVLNCMQLRRESERGVTIVAARALSGSASPLVRWEMQGNDASRMGLEMQAKEMASRKWFRSGFEWGFRL